MEIIHSPEAVDIYGVNPKLVGIQTDTDLSELNLRCEFTLYRAEPQEILITLNNYYDEDGTVYFNLSKFMPLDYDLPNPDNMEQLEIIKCEKCTGSYFAIIREYYGITGTAQNTIALSFHYAIKGGRSPITARHYNFMADFSENHKFLTHQPRKKLITRQQPEWLYFPDLKTYGQQFKSKITVELTFDDNSTQILETVIQFDDEFGKVFIIPAGFTQLTLQQYEIGKTIISYKLMVRQGIGESISSVDGKTITLYQDSEVFEYEIDFTRQSWKKRYFLFENSLGGCDVLCTRGKTSRVSNQKRQLIQIAETINSPVHQHRESNSFVSAKEEVQVSIGWLELPERTWLKELGLAKNMWEIDIENKRFIPIRITSNNIKIDEDDNPLQDSSFTFEYSEQEAY